MFLMHSSVILEYMVSIRSKEFFCYYSHAYTENIQVFNGMAQYYQGFIKDFTFIMAPITKLLQNT
jgi:hypothetical protein